MCVCVCRSKNTKNFAQELEHGDNMRHVKVAAEKGKEKSLTNSIKCTSWTKMYLSPRDFFLEKKLYLYFDIGSKAINSCDRPRLWVPTVSPNSSNSWTWNIIEFYPNIKNHIFEEIRSDTRYDEICLTLLRKTDITPWTKIMVQKVHRPLYLYQTNYPIISQKNSYFHVTLL